MKHTYTFAAVSPSLDENGQLISISFSVTAEDEFGNTAIQSVIGTGGLPLPADITYTDEELLDICEAIAGEQKVYTQLDSVVQIKRTPIWQAQPPPTPLTATEKKTLWMGQIDANVAAVYSQFTRFQLEYEQREKAAKAYKDAGYTGDPTIWLTAFADSNGIPYNMCADLVLAQANQLRGAVSLLGRYRMNKYKVKNALTIEDAEVEFGKVIADVTALARSL